MAGRSYADNYNQLFEGPSSSCYYNGHVIKDNLLEISSFESQNSHRVQYHKHTVGLSGRTGAGHEPRKPEDKGASNRGLIYKAPCAYEFEFQSLSLVPPQPSGFSSVHGSQQVACITHRIVEGTFPLIVPEAWLIIALSLFGNPVNHAQTDPGTPSICSGPCGR